MKFIHGSPTDIRQTNNSKFRLFDYLTKVNGEPDGHVNNGQDQFGPGIYAFPGEGNNYQNSIKGAACYTDKESGFVYILSVDVEEPDFINAQPIDKIDESIWVDVIERFITKRRDQENCSLDDFHEAVDKIMTMVNDGDDVADDFVKETFKQFDGMDFDYLKLESADDIDEWESQVTEQYFLADPCSSIFDEGGPEAIVQYAMTASDNLWEVLKTIWNRTAVVNSGIGYNTYNDTFQKSVLEVFAENEITNFKVAKVNDEYEDNYFFVIFDTDSIQIEKVINVTNQHDYEAALAP
jgi:hypothetical protein